MAGATVTLEARGLATTLRVLGALALVGRDLSPVMREAAATIEAHTRLRFIDQKSPDGVAWKPSARVKREGGRTLTDKGRLLGSITADHGRTWASVGTNLIYGAIHQFGGTIRPKNAAWLAFKLGDRWVKTKRVVLPARPFLGLDDADREDIEALVVDFLAGALR